jgi:L-rhamnose mutarotase
MQSSQQRDIHRISFILYLKDGAAQEYKKRHDCIWKEMKDMLKEAGIFNYSIWLNENTVFGYYETHDIHYTKEYKSIHPVQQQWNDYMKDIMQITDAGETNIIYPEQVFLLE